MKVCKQCNVELTDENWYKSFQKSYSYVCKACHVKRTKHWEANNPERVKELQKKSKKKMYSPDRSREYYHKRPEVGMWSRAKKRAIDKNIPFNIEVEDIAIPSVCPVLGIKIEVNKGISKPSSPSLDKIDPTKGYVKGNIWVISHKANTVKNDLTLNEMKTILSNLIKVLECH